MPQISERGAFSWSLVPPVLPGASLVGPGTLAGGHLLRGRYSLG